MPCTPAEMIAVLNALLTDALSPDDVGGTVWADGDGITAGELRDVRALYIYAVAQRRYRQHKRGPQRRAFRLLVALLSSDQRAQLRRTDAFRVTAASGATYRLWPRTGHVTRVQRHGSRWYLDRTYCLHDDEGPDSMPPADVTIAHLLLLRADEDRFLATANARDEGGQLWNRDYLRRLRERKNDA